MRTSAAVTLPTRCQNDTTSSLPETPARSTEVDASGRDTARRKPPILLRLTGCTLALRPLTEE
jgi:hypothetical protein